MCPHMNELLNSIRLQISQRLSSPLFGAFALSWLTINHKYLVILFSSEDIEKRISYAHEVAFPTWKALWLNGAIYPILSAFGFLTLYPLLARLAYWWWEKQQIALKALKLDLNKQKPVNEEEHFKLVSQLDELERKHEERIAILKQENHRQSMDLAQSERFLKEAKGEVNGLLEKSKEYNQRLKEAEENQTALVLQLGIVVKAKDKEIQRFQDELANVDKELEDLRKENREKSLAAATLQLAKDLPPIGLDQKSVGQVSQEGTNNIQRQWDTMLKKASDKNKERQGKLPPEED